MVLKNYSSLMWWRNYQTGSGVKPTIEPTVDMSGNTYPTGLTKSSNDNDHTMHIMNLDGAVVGSGNTAPTIDDYALDNDISSSFTSLSMTLATSLGIDSVGNSVVARTCTITGSNSGSSDLTIKEVGLYKNMYTTATGVKANFLCVREVLSTPLTVTAGDSFTITITWKE